MIGLFFLLLCVAGVYLLCRSRYELSIGQFVSYTIMFVVFGIITYYASHHVGRELRGLGVGQPIQFPPRDPEPDFQVIELDANDLDPEIQEALLGAVMRLRTRRNLTPTQILEKMTEMDSTEGDCGVCYDTMEEGVLLGCPQCHKPAHKKCMEQWLESGQAVCIYCRKNLGETEA